MPGPRFNDWHHTRYEGDPGAGKQHLPLARKVLGAVIEEARAAGVNTLKRVHRPGGGVEIVAEIHGSQPRVTIRTGIEETTEQRVRLGDFVVTAKDAARPGGIDDEHPEQILKAEWTTFFFDQDIAGYNEFGRRKGTYRYGDGGVEQFPDGIRHAGNVDWRGDDGSRVSWYGPSSRYWFDRWRQPSAQYGRYVFLLGQTLLDVDAYCTAAGIDFDERLVLGAALDGSSLLVMQAEIDDVPPDAIPVGRGGDVYLSRPYPNQPVALRLVRYGLLVDQNEPEPLRLFVSTGSHETLWAGSGVGWINPWVFNPAANVAETFAMPSDPLLHQYRLPLGAGFDYRLASASSEHLILTISPAVALSTQLVSLQVNQAEAFAPIAADYDYRGNRVVLEFGYRAIAAIPNYASGSEDTAATGISEWANYFLRANGREVKLFETDPSDLQNATWRRPIALDLRFRTFVFVETKQTPEFQFSVSLRFESRPDLSDETPLFTEQVINGGPPVHTGWQALCWWAGASEIAPLSMLFGAIVIGKEGAFSGPGYYDDIGFNPMWYLPEANQLFGTVAFYHPTIGTVLTSQSSFQSRGYTTYWNNRQDTHGKRNPVGLAVGDDHLLYSGPGWFEDLSSGGVNSPTGKNFISGSELGLLTGVTGSERTFHPLWVLGEIPTIAKS